VINNLFRIYFILNRTRLCKNLIRPLEGKNFPSLDQFPASQTVTYKYFVGRLSLFDGKFKQAEEELTGSFRRCTKNAPLNKRAILMYLIPVKILLGKMPSSSLLSKYNLFQFVDLVMSIKTGNLKVYTETMKKNQQFFTQKGIYLNLEKSKVFVYRTLFKRIFLITKSTKLSLHKIALVFSWLGCPIELDELECILANLIFSGYIKGYLSHQMRVLVVSAKNAFPPLSSMQ